MGDRELLRRTADLAADDLDTVDTNRVPATDSYVEARDRFDVPLNDEPTEPLAVVEELVEKAGPGLVGIQSGRKGVAELVEGSCRHARAIAAGLAELPGCTILNDVVLNQVLFRFEDDERTRAIHAAVMAEGEVYLSPSTWDSRAVIRVSVSNWRTNERDVERLLAAFGRAASARPARAS